MSYYEAATASSTIGYGSVDMVIKTREMASGSVNLRRILPAEDRALVGPFVLLDHFGPNSAHPGSSFDIAAPSVSKFVTLDYLFDGELILGESCGSERAIQSGDLYLSSAGCGTPEPNYHSSNSGELPMLHGLHAWIALPPEKLDCEPAIEHHSADKIPKVKIGDATISVILGQVYGKTSPAKGHKSTLCLICELLASSEFNLPSTYAELAVYVVGGCLEINGDSYPESTMAVAALGWPVILRTKTPSTVLIIGSR